MQLNTKKPYYEHVSDTDPSLSALMSDYCQGETAGSLCRFRNCVLDPFPGYHTEWGVIGQDNQLSSMVVT